MTTTSKTKSRVGKTGPAAKINAVVQTAARKLELHDFERPAVGPDDAILRVELCGICGSDIEQYAGQLKVAEFPMIPGHEPLGIIDEIGEKAAKRWGVKVGDRVAVESTLTCGSCEHCQTGSRTTCEHNTIYGYIPTYVAPGVWGAYADYMYLHPDTVMHKISKDIPAQIAALYNPLCAGVRWAMNAPSLHVGETIVILGSGQRGLASVIAARAAGAGKIIVTDVARAASKLEIARELGAHHVIVADEENAIEQVARLTGGRLADVVVDVSNATQPVADAPYMVRKGGIVVIAGIKGNGVKTSFETDFLVTRSITLRGVFTVDNASYRQAIRMLESGAAPFEKLMTKRFPLPRAEEAIHRLAGWDGAAPSIHVVIDPAG
jgi:threonine dehydrogenase-like Zn-dependent dehydrogenase